MKAENKKQNRLKPLAYYPCCLALLVLAGCIRLSTDPIKVEPIYIEITINHRVQKELDDVFADLDQASETTEYEPLNKEVEK